MEEYLEPFWWREDFVFPRFGIRVALLQAHSLIRDGRNRRRSRLQECFDSRQLY